MSSLQPYSPSSPSLQLSQLSLPFWANVKEICLVQYPVISTALEALNERVNVLYAHLSKFAISTFGMIQNPVSGVKQLAQLANEHCISLMQLESKVTSVTRRIFDFLKRSSNKSPASQYGNKFYNLKLQVSLNNAVSSIGIQVPEPFGITNTEIQRFLQSESPLVFSIWQKLSSNYSSESSNFLELPQTQELLNQLENEIARSFERLGIDPALFKNYISEEILELLNKTAAAGRTLMVRSSGAEDSKAVVNAGGNASKSYVISNQKGLAKAIGEVIASYFSINSLKNRIRAGSNPFKEKLQMSVTIQPLIGETVGQVTKPGDIPVSMVVFSNEPMFIGNEKFRVMRINSSFGHGEGVVGEQGIPTDTYTVFISETNPENLYIIQDIKEKRYRLAPVETEEGIFLRQVENPLSLMNRPSLSYNQIARIYIWSTMSEQLFDGDATDMEMVIKNDILYPVQARPIKRLALLPTYVDVKAIEELQTSPIDDYLFTETLVASKTSALILQSKDEVFFAPTLKKAEELFIKEKHKLVIVTTEEPANSHPIVNFASLGIPCLYTADKVKPENMLLQISDSKQMVVCMQTGNIYLWNRDIAQPDAFIKNGFAVHPAQIAHSYPLKSNIPAIAPSPIPKSCKQLMQALKESSNDEMALLYLNKLKQENHIQNLNLDISSLSLLIENSSNVPNQALEILNLLMHIKSHVGLAFSELETILNKKSPNKRLQTLLQIKILENAFIGNPKRSGIGHYSSLDASQLYQKAKILIEYQNEFKHSAQCLDLLFMADSAYEVETFEKWRGFLFDIEKDFQNGQLNIKELNRLKQTLALLEEMNLTTNWLTMFFKHSLNVYEGLAANLLPSYFASSPIQKVLKSLPSYEELNLIKSFSNFSQKLKIEKGRVESELGLGLAKNRYDKMKLLIQMLIEQRDDITTVLSSASPMTKNALLETLEELSDLFDFSIKNMKSDLSILEEEKTALFKDMVELYFSFLEKFVDKSSSLLTLPKVRYKDNFADTTTYQGVLALVRNEFEKMSKDDSANLRPSNNFSVDAAKIGASGSIDRNLPKTIEDVFTYVHQSLISCFSNLRNKIYTVPVIQSSSMPDDFKNQILSLTSAANSLFIKTRKVDLLRFDKRKKIYPERINLEKILAAQSKLEIERRRDEVSSKSSQKLADVEIFRSEIASLYPKLISERPSLEQLKQQRLAWIKGGAATWIKEGIAKRSSVIFQDSSRLRYDEIQSNLQHFNLQRSGIQINDQEVKVTYNLPLRYHSAQLVLSYDKSTKQSFITMQLLGESFGNRDCDRWDFIARKASFYAKLFNMNFASPPFFNEKEIKVKFEIKNQQQYDLIVEVIALILDSADSADTNYSSEFYLTTTYPDIFFNSLLEENLAGSTNYLASFEALCMNPKATKENFQKVNEYTLSELESSDPQQQILALKKLMILMYNKLIDKQSVLKTLDKFLQSSNDNLRAEAIGILKDFVSSGELYETGIKIALANIEENDSTTYESVNLLRTLWLKGYGFEKSVDFIINHLKTNENVVQIYEYLILLSELFSFKQGFAQATQLAESFIASDDPAKHFIAYEIFERLSEYNESISIARACIQLQKNRGIK